MRARTPWLVFAAALIVVVAVMALVTSKLVALDRQRAQADERGAHEEQVRLALWRLDSETTPLLMQEISALGIVGDTAAEQALPPAPAYLRGRFVLAPDGALRVVGDPAGVDAAQLATLVVPRDQLARLPEPLLADGSAMLDNPVQRATATKVEQPVATKGSYSVDEQRMFNGNELVRRIEAVSENFEGYGSSIANTRGRGGLPPSAPAPPAGAVRPVWLGDELFLLRRVGIGAGETIHGAWLNWPVLRGRLVAEISGPLPGATLIAVPDDALASSVDNLLATLPVRLVAGPPAVVAAGASSLLPSLALGWLGVLAAIVAVFAVLRWSLALSERRAEFVSTVTHELRTPLTTFRMYAEMLDEGMVDATKRAGYIATMRREADRLGELVENVLAYARIESDRAPLTPEVMTVQALLHGMTPRLTERATAVGLTLAIDLDTTLGQVRVRVDPTAAEQILFNLVDNAAKYGSSPAMPRIEITARTQGTRVALCVRDHGPGIAVHERKAIFEPFAKAQVDLSGTKPGVGLGLALCRRLARQLSGELSVEAANPGARFVFALPRVH